MTRALYLCYFCHAFNSDLSLKHKQCYLSFIFAFICSAHCCSAAEVLHGPRKPRKPFSLAGCPALMVTQRNHHRFSEIHACKSSQECMISPRTVLRLCANLRFNSTLRFLVTHSSSVSYSLHFSRARLQRAQLRNALGNMCSAHSAHPATHRHTYSTNSPHTYST